MKIKVLLWSVVSILILGLAAVAYWWLSRPQVITFSDGAKVTLLAVQYGRRHAQPAVKASGTPANRPAARGRGSFTTTNDTLVLWVRQEYDASGNQYHNFQYYIYDQAETACAQTYGGRNYAGNTRQGNEVVAVQLDAFPRRHGKFYVRVQEQGNSGQEISDQKFTVANPAHVSSTAWAAQALPVKAEDGDLTVTLTKLVAGAAMPYQRDSDDADDAMNKGVQVAYRAERGGKPVTNWEPVSVETTDATGNRTTVNYGPNGNQVQWNGDEGAFTYQYGLWPDEPAWKLRMEMTQTADFSGDEEWTAKNIPVVPGDQQSFNSIAGIRTRAVMRNGVVVRVNPPGGDSPPPAPFAEADLNGHHVKVFPVVQFTNAPANMPANFTPPQQVELIVQVQPALLNGGMRIINGPNGTQLTDDGLRMSLAKVTDGQGDEITSMNGGMSMSGMGGANSTSTFRFRLNNMAGVTNVNATIAMHKNRFVEFTAKPVQQPASNSN